MKPKLDYEIIHAIATDEGNKRMILGTRHAWNQEDYNRACKIADELQKEKMCNKSSYQAI